MLIYGYAAPKTVLVPIEPTVSPIRQTQASRNRLGQLALQPSPKLGLYLPHFTTRAKSNDHRADDRYTRLTVAQNQTHTAQIDFGSAVGVVIALQMGRRNRPQLVNLERIVRVQVRHGIATFAR
jgi:hypothetical protein